MPISDLDLITRVLLEEDHDAFGELVRRYQSPLRAWLRRLANGDVALADDLAQETFLRAYRQLKGFRREGKFSSWLFRIAYNQFRSEARRFREKISLDEEFLETYEATEAPESENDGLKDDLDEAMKYLTLEQRSALTLCYQQGLTHGEAAAILDCPLGTVKTNILRGKEKLRRYFSTIESKR